VGQCLAPAAPAAGDVDLVGAPDAAKMAAPAVRADHSVVFTYHIPFCSIQGTAEKPPLFSRASP
jgi:hypothetical protein